MRLRLMGTPHIQNVDGNPFVRGIIEKPYRSWKGNGFE